VTDFHAWLSQDEERNDELRLLTWKAWEELWSVRPELPGMVEAYNTASAQILNPEIYTLGSAFSPEVRGILGSRVSIRVTPTAGLTGRHTEDSSGRTIVFEEGLLRYLYTMMSLAVSSLDPPLEDTPIGDGFLDGIQAPDDETLSRVASVYAGSLRETDGHYLPLKIVQTGRGRGATRRMLTGAITFLITHELGHACVNWLSDYRSRTDWTNLIVTDPQYLEAYCDSIAALLSGIAFTKVENDADRALQLAGVLLVPRLLEFLDDVRFISAPTTHPPASQRREYIRELLEEIVPRKIIGTLERTIEPISDAIDRMIEDVTSLRGRPKAASHLANCLHPCGRIQFLIRDGSNEGAPSLRDDGKWPDYYIMCSLAVTTSEERARERTVSFYSQLVRIGQHLCENRALTAQVDSRLKARLEVVFRSVVDPKRVSDAERPHVFESFLLAVVGQHFFYTVFLQRLLPQMVRDGRVIDGRGITLDLAWRRFPDISPQVITAGASCCDRRRRGEDFFIPIDEELAESLYATVVPMSSLRDTPSVG
jgi:hypothetical protein